MNPTKQPTKTKDWLKANFIAITTRITELGQHTAHDALDEWVLSFGKERLVVACYPRELQLSHTDGSGNNCLVAWTKDSGDVQLGKLSGETGFLALFPLVEKASQKRDALAAQFGYEGKVRLGMPGRQEIEAKVRSRMYPSLRKQLEMEELESAVDTAVRSIFNSRRAYPEGFNTTSKNGVNTLQCEYAQFADRTRFKASYYQSGVGEVVVATATRSAHDGSISIPTSQDARRDVLEELVHIAQNLSRAECRAGLSFPVDLETGTLYAKQQDYPPVTLESLQDTLRQARNRAFDVKLKVPTSPEIEDSIKECLGKLGMPDELLSKIAKVGFQAFLESYKPDNWMKKLPDISGLRSFPSSEKMSPDVVGPVLSKEQVAPPPNPEMLFGMVRELANRFRKADGSINCSMFFGMVGEKRELHVSARPGQEGFSVSFGGSNWTLRDDLSCSYSSVSPDSPLELLQKLYPEMRRRVAIQQRAKAREMIDASNDERRAQESTEAQSAIAFVVQALYGRHRRTHMLTDPRGVQLSNLGEVVCFDDTDKSTSLVLRKYLGRWRFAKGTTKELFSIAETLGWEGLR